MKTDLRYLFKVSAILTIAIFLIERSISATGFNLPAIELFQILDLKASLNKMINMNFLLKNN